MAILEDIRNKQYAALDRGTEPTYLFLGHRQMVQLVDATKGLCNYTILNKSGERRDYTLDGMLLVEVCKDNFLEVA